jgi:hypothetical protein
MGRVKAIAYTFQKKRCQHLQEELEGRHERGGEGLSINYLSISLRNLHHQGKAPTVISLWRGRW